MEKQQVTSFEMHNNEIIVAIKCREKENEVGFDYFLEFTPISNELEKIATDQNQMHDSFYGAFDELNERFPWHDFQPVDIDEDFSEYVADLLVEKINDSNRLFRNAQKKEFEEILGIHLKTREVEIKTGIFSIDVESLNKVTDYDYQEFVDSYAQEIGQKFKLLSTVERWETFNAESFEFVGNIEIAGNSVILKDSDGDVRYILAADKYKFTVDPLTYSAEKWEWVSVRK